MAGIFNLFGGLSEPDKGVLAKPLSRSNVTPGRLSAKAVGQSKPKGLSMRSNSDVNVPVTPRSNGSKQEGSNSKQQEFLKPKLTQLDNVGRPVSPMKGLSVKKSNMRPNKRILSPKKESLDGKMMKSQKLSDEVVFKKPLPPKKMKRPVFAEPENLAPYYNFDYDFDDIYIKPIENEFKELLKGKELIKPFEDEGFESDPEQLTCPKIPSLLLYSEVSDEECEKNCSLASPDISDDDDNF